MFTHKVLGAVLENNQFLNGFLSPFLKIIIICDGWPLALIVCSGETLSNFSPILAAGGYIQVWVRKETGVYSSSIFSKYSTKIPPILEAV